VLSLCCGPLHLSRADTPDEQYQFANGLYSQKLWSLAAEKLRAFVTEFPNHPRARNAAYQLGGALYRATNGSGQTDYAAVAAAYERAITKYPDAKLTPPARFELGDAYYNLGKYDQAIAAHRAFLGSNPHADTAAQAQYWIGESYYALKKPAEARTAYQTVLTKYPTSPIAAYAQYSLGLLALDAAQYAPAANAFRAVLAKHPNSEVAPESRLRLGDALLGAKQWTAARDAFRTVQQDARASAWKSDAALGLADAEFGAKNWPSAATAYEQALAALKPDDTRRNAAQFRLGDSLYNDKRYEQALRAYAPLLASKDSKVLPTALYWNGNALRALNRHNEAAASYRRLISEYSTHALAPRAALRLGDTLSDAKDTGAAAEAYRVVLTKYAKSDAAREAQQALVALAGEVAGSSNAGGANSSAGGASLEQVLRALPPGPASSNAQLQLAQAAFANGNWARASQLAQSALAGKPDAATAENARYLLASTKLRAGDARAAAAAFRQQLTQFPRGTLATQARLGLAWAWLDAKKWSDAESAARAVLSVPGQNAAPVREQARLALGEALLRNGKSKDALTVFAVAEKSASKDVAAQAAYGAALSLEARKQWGAAAARWNNLATLSAAGDARARAHLRQGMALLKAKQVASLAASIKQSLLIRKVNSLPRHSMKAPGQRTT
jgi:TolA-binding protein